MVLVTGGRLAILAEDEDGQSTELAEMAIGDIVGEMSAIDPAPRSATVKAKGAASICVLDRTMLSALFSNAPTVYSSLLTGIGRAVTTRLERTNKNYKDEAFGQMAVLESPKNVPEEASGTLSKAPSDPAALKPLSGFTPQERAMLLKAASVISFESGDALCSEGKPGHTCFVIGGGEVEVLRHSGDEEYHLATLGPGTVVGQLALLHDSPRSATVRARGPVWVVAIGRGVFSRLLAKRDALALKLQEQAIVAGIRQLRLASRMLTDLRGGLEEEKPPEAPSAELSDAEEVDTAMLLDELKSPEATTSTQWKAPERVEHAPSARRPPPARRPSAPSERPKRSGPLAAERARRNRQAWRAVEGGQTTPKARRKGGRIKTPTQQMAMYVTTALSEWGMSLSDLDKVEVSVPEGQITAAELKARKLY